MLDHAPVTRASRPPRPVGILGGMGPLAGASLHMRLLERAAEVYHCSADTDYPRITHVSVRLPLWDARGFPQRAHAYTDTVLRANAHRLAQLLGPEPGVIVMACNTAHIFLEGVREAVASARPEAPEATVIDLVSETVAAAKRLDPAPRQFAVFASESAHDAQLYRALPMIDPSATQLMVTAAIAAVMRGAYGTAADHLTQAVEAAVAGGAETIVLGCTELPLAACWMPVPSVDSVTAGIDAALRESFGR